MTAIVEFDPIGAESIKSALGPEAAVLPGLDALHAHLDLNLFEDGQQQRADVCVSDVEPHVRSVERACHRSISRVRDSHGFSGASRTR